MLATLQATGIYSFRAFVLRTMCLFGMRGLEKYNRSKNRKIGKKIDCFIYLVVIFVTIKSVKFSPGLVLARGLEVWDVY